MACYGALNSFPQLIYNEKKLSLSASQVFLLFFYPFQSSLSCLRYLDLTMSEKNYFSQSFHKQNVIFMPIIIVNNQQMHFVGLFIS